MVNIASHQEMQTNTNRTEQRLQKQIHPETKLWEVEGLYITAAGSTGCPYGERLISTLTPATENITFTWIIEPMWMV